MQVFSTLPRSSLTRAVELAEVFWTTNLAESRCVQRFAAAVHSLFLGQSPWNLEFESFVYLYTAIDACYALAAKLRQPPRHLKHADRIAWRYCQVKQFGGILAARRHR